eukprot:c6439_g1_i1.p1 GENE.c6439_g1_i1~~c6439_g1_i1.p1  ORF type:complete len:463 (+),score=115.50 c6439_g1_i1:42-1430(+)
MRTDTPPLGLGPLTADSVVPLQIIGKGSSGRVYLTRVKGEIDLFAMKTYKKYQIIKQDRVANILNERNIFGALNHPFITPLLCAFQDTKQLNLVMEFCPGGELFSLLRKKRDSMTEAAARFYAAEILVVLEYLHAHGITYRDLKAENVLLARSGHIRLTDFDLSVMHAPATVNIVSSPPVQGLNSYNTRVKHKMTDFVGTLEYVAPEVLNKKPYDDMVDWWSYGVMVCELVTGHGPYPSSIDRTALTLAVRKGTVAIPQDSMSAECFDLLKQLLQFNPSNRLGNRNGAADIKSHAWFRGINFEMLRHVTPPFVPNVTSQHDTSNFTVQIDDDDDHTVSVTAEANHVFRDFDFCCSARNSYGVEGHVTRPAVNHTSIIEQYHIDCGHIPTPMSPISPISPMSHNHDHHIEDVAKSHNESNSASASRSETQSAGVVSNVELSPLEQRILNIPTQFVSYLTVKQS